MNIKEKFPSIKKKEEGICVALSPIRVPKEKKEVGEGGPGGG